MSKFRGLFPAIVTPMTAEGTLNERAFRQVMEFNIQAGVHGFWVAGGSGESILLDDAENRRIAEIATDQSGGRIANIMHVGAPTTARAAALAEHAANAGVEAICCVPPFFYRHDDESIVEHYRVVAAAADLPFFVYNLPQATGVEITPAPDAKNPGTCSSVGRAKALSPLPLQRPPLCQNGAGLFHRQLSPDAARPDYRGGRLR